MAPKQPMITRKSCCVKPTGKQILETAQQVLRHQDRRKRQETDEAVDGDLAQHVAREDAGEPHGRLSYRPRPSCARRAILTVLNSLPAPPAGANASS